MSARERASLRAITRLALSPNEFPERASTGATLFAIQWQIVILPFSAFLLFALTGFEVLVAFLQAFIFTILTAVYIGQSMHPEH